MSNARILFVGVLALVAVLAVSAIITALAPYLAILIVVSCGCWAVANLSDGTKEDPPEKQLRNFLTKDSER